MAQLSQPPGNQLLVPILPQLHGERCVRHNTVTMLKQLTTKDDTAVRALVDSVLRPPGWVEIPLLGRQDGTVPRLRMTDFRQQQGITSPVL